MLFNLSSVKMFWHLKLEPDILDNYKNGTQNYNPLAFYFILEKIKYTDFDLLKKFFIDRHKHLFAICKKIDYYLDLNRLLVRFDFHF